MKPRSAVSTGVSVGGSSILLIFVLLCLTTFAVLSLVSANADKKLTDKSALAVSEYYAADGAAEEILVKIDTALRETLINNGEEAFYNGAEAVIASIEPSANVDGRQVSYEVTLNASQSLSVSFGLVFSPGSYLYELYEWRVVNTDVWEPEDEEMNLWTGSDEIVILG